MTPASTDQAATAFRAHAGPIAVTYDQARGTLTQALEAKKAELDARQAELDAERQRLGHGDS